jgi:hypothetical protein
MNGSDFDDRHKSLYKEIPDKFCKVKVGSTIFNLYKRKERFTRNLSMFYLAITVSRF